MASDKVHGITIEIDANTSGVTESFKDINKELNSTQKELNTVDKMLKQNGDDTRLLAQKQQLLSNAIEETQSKLARLAQAKAEADNSDSLDKNSEKYRELERDIIKTQSALENLNSQYKENDNKMKGISDDAKEMGDSLVESSESATKFGDILSANVLADFVVEGIKKLANAFIDLGKSLASSVKESAEFADDINTLSKQYNLSTKELQAYSRASELIDVDVETIASSMSKLTKNMTSTSSGTVSAFQKLGVATTDATGELRDSNTVFYEIIEALSQISNETEQDSLAMDIFGKGAAELGTLINGGTESLAELNKYLEENNLILSDEELNSLNELNDGFDMLDTTWSAMKDKLSAELAPAMQPILDGLVETLNTISPQLNELIGNVAGFVEEHQEDIEGFIEGFVDFITGDDFGGFVDDVGTILSNMWEVGEAIVDAEKKTKILHTTWKVFSELVNGVLLMVKQIAEMISGEYDWLEAKNTQANPYIRNGTHSSLGFGEALKNLSSGGFSSGGITLNNTINVNNNGSDISASTVNQWADIMTSRINENLGRLL